MAKNLIFFAFRVSVCVLVFMNLNFANIAPPPNKCVKFANVCLLVHSFANIAIFEPWSSSCLLNVRLC